MNMDSKNSILLIDPAFELNTTERCSLLIKLSADSFSYAIVDETDQKLKVLYDQQECDQPGAALLAKIESDDHLTQKFGAVKVAVHTPNIITVPNDLFDPSLLNDYGKYFTSPLSDKLHISEPEGFDLKLLFTIEPFLQKQLTSFFPDCEFYNQFSPLFKLADLKSELSMNLDFTVGTLNTVILNHEKLWFHNSFEVSDAGELNYYLLFMAKQLNIDLQDVRISVSGIIHEGDQLHGVLSQYAKQITFLSPINTSIDQDIISDMPDQYYCSLLALAQCG